MAMRKKGLGTGDWGLDGYALGCALMAMVALAGCGRGELSISKVSGRVTVDGAPVKEGIILFVPERGPVASGAIVGGQYSLTTHSSGDGAVEGKHLVFFAPQPQAAPPLRDNVEGPDMATERPCDFPPPMYSAPETSGLSAEVKSGSNTFDFDLKTSGGDGSFGQ
jgi:hypothetical protein